MRTAIRTFIAAALLLCATLADAQSGVTKETVPGITNFSKVETTVACAGATTPGALVDVKKMGYNSVINLRMANEAGAQIEEEAAAAKAAGINYIHLPFNNASPDPAVVDKFLVAITDKANQPAFIHCASANRAAMMWMVKRIAIDKWDVDKATEEATALGLTNPTLKAFAIEQAKKH
ncbi:MAG TPA: sulfur transferase domain-containing protein [Vicinamibacterales bacterium]|nr:sulfur transferase domain-containing protein [Vicinamibacterales bacterium]